METDRSSQIPDTRHVQTPQSRNNPEHSNGTTETNRYPHRNADFASIVSRNENTQNRRGGGEVPFNIPPLSLENFNLPKNLDTSILDSSLKKNQAQHLQALDVSPTYNEPSHGNTQALFMEPKLKYFAASHTDFIFLRGSTLHLHVQHKSTSTRSVSTNKSAQTSHHDRSRGAVQPHWPQKAGSVVVKSIYNSSTDYFTLHNNSLGLRPSTSSDQFSPNLNLTQNNTISNGDTPLSNIPSPKQQQQHTEIHDKQLPLTEHHHNVKDCTANNQNETPSNSQIEDISNQPNRTILIPNDYSMNKTLHGDYIEQISPNPTSTYTTTNEMGDDHTRDRYIGYNLTSSSVDDSNRINKKKQVKKKQKKNYRTQEGDITQGEGFLFRSADEEVQDHGGRDENITSDKDTQVIDTHVEDHEDITIYDYDETEVDMTEDIIKNLHQMKCKEDLRIHQRQHTDIHSQRLIFHLNQHEQNGERMKAKNSKGKDANMTSTSSSDLKGQQQQQQQQQHNEGAWDEEEHQQFLAGLGTVGRNWQKISRDYVLTRSRTQVASHAQKYFKKVEKQKDKQSKHYNYMFTSPDSYEKKIQQFSP